MRRAAYFLFSLLVLPHLVFAAKEDDLLDAANALRTNPSSFVSDLLSLKERFEGNRMRLAPHTFLTTKEGAAAVDEAIAFVKKAKPIPRLVYSEPLTKAAQWLVADESRTGETGHIASEGITPRQRMLRFADITNRSGENVSYGDYAGSSGRGVVIAWLVDDGVKGRGHRANLMDPLFHYAGVACGTHPRFRDMCVIDLADGAKAK